MGHVNAPMILGTLSVVEMALAALGIPHGKGGITAAVEFLAKSAPA
jgi:alanine-glyoxylate transaminase/serine-glyoxylate transaminase/serine-pyruvate transaminase